jgi:hypothetical protein
MGVPRPVLADHVDQCLEMAGKPVELENPGNGSSFPALACIHLWHDSSCFRFQVPLSKQPCKGQQRLA